MRLICLFFITNFAIKLVANMSRNPTYQYQKALQRPTQNQTLVVYKSTRNEHLLRPIKTSDSSPTRTDNIIRQFTRRVLARVVSIIMPNRTSSNSQRSLNDCDCISTTARVKRRRRTQQTTQQFSSTVSTSTEMSTTEEDGISTEKFVKPKNKVLTNNSQYTTAKTLEYPDNFDRQIKTIDGRLMLPDESRIRTKQPGINFDQLIMPRYDENYRDVVRRTKDDGSENTEPVKVVVEVIAPKRSKVRLTKKRKASQFRSKQKKKKVRRKAHRRKRRKGRRKSLITKLQKQFMNHNNLKAEHKAPLFGPDRILLEIFKHFA